MFKCLLFFFLISIAGLISTAATSGFQKSQDVVDKLGKYNLENDKTPLGDAQLDEMYSDLEQAAKFSEKNQLSADAAFQMERVTLLIYRRDPYLYSTFILIPAYSIHKKIFVEAAARLHPTDHQKILAALDEAEHFYEHGDSED